MAVLHGVVRLGPDLGGPRSLRVASSASASHQAAAEEGVLAGVEGAGGKRRLDPERAGGEERLGVLPSTNRSSTRTLVAKRVWMTARSSAKATSTRWVASRPSGVPGLAVTTVAGTPVPSERSAQRVSLVVPVREKSTTRS